MRPVLRLWAGLMVIAAGAVHVPPAASTQTEEEVEAGLSAAPEERSLRTRNSRTLRTPDGALKVVVYPGPIHYRDPSGTWRIVHANMLHPRAYPWTLAQLGDVRTEWFFSTDATPNPRIQQVRLEVMFVESLGG